MNTKDMTKGTPWKLLLGFSLPLMAGNVFQQLYTFIDTMIVGQALGVDALAALGATEWMTFMMFGLITGITQGFGVVIAQRFGASDTKGLYQAVMAALYLTVGGAVLFTALGELLITPVLGLLGTPADIIGLAAEYLRILYAGIPIAFAYNLLAAILRAMGDSRTPLQAMVASSTVNILLDICFVFGLKWGIAGAAAATLTAQLAAVLVCAYKLFAGRGVLIERGQKKEEAISYLIYKEELKIAIPLGLQNMITAIGGLAVQSVINSFGVLFIAGFTAANKLYGLLEIAASSYGYAMSTYTGQNMGAGHKQRIRQGLRSAVMIGVITAGIMSAVMVLAGKPILSCFIAGEAKSAGEALQTGYQFLMVLACFFWLLYLLYIVRACLQGMGNSILPMISSMVQLIMRVGCAFLLTRYVGEQGIFYGEVAAWIGADILLLAGYSYFMKAHTLKM